jgi:uncharacterized coiled-coil protein SlyX
MNKEMPIYVKIDEYKEILDVINMIKTKVAEAKETLGEINKIKNEEDAELERWHLDLEEVERKMEYVDKALFEPEAL